MEEVARSDSDRGELVLRRRDDGHLELRVNGVFVMDTAETSTERALATTALDVAPGDLIEVLVAGLGLGYTLDAVLADQRVVAVTVAEIEPTLVRWHRAGVVPQRGPGASVLDDSRVTVAPGDVRRLVEDTADASYDLVLLDVDNGPDYLVYDENADVYAPAFLAACGRVTRPGGVVAIWSSESSPALLGSMAAVFDDAWESVIPVTLQGRATTYHLYLGRA